MQHEPQPFESVGSGGEGPNSPNTPAERVLPVESARRPTFVYDGDCGFCRMWVSRWRTRVGESVAFEPYQTAASAFPQVPPERFARFAQFIEPDGTVFEGAAAVFRALRHQRGRRWMWWTYCHMPLMKPLCDFTYRVVADHRRFMSAMLRVLWGDVSEEPRYVVTRSIFLRLLGVVYLIAFLSLGSQILGLNGERGILPARQVMDWHEQRLASASTSERLLHVPTLCWFADSDASLTWQCRAGAILSVLLILGVAPIPVLIALWGLYLSLSFSQNLFLSFQWDTLLTETGFLAIFLAPLRLWMRKRSDPPPSRFALWMIRLLLFKLMFLSGVVKLTSGDTTWRDYTALNYHYETQPLPAWTSWYAHQLPQVAQQVSLVIAFTIELVIPFLIFFPRNLRHLAGYSTVFLMMMIGLTGNYNFFNLLTVILCIPLFDDCFWRSLVPKRLRRTSPTAAPLPRTRWVRGTALAAILAGYVYVSTLQGVRGSWPGRRDGAALPAFTTTETAQQVLTTLAPFRTINAYGLFRVMTTTRPEIVIEGSRDGREWLAYEFPWKPGEVNRRPEFAQPHQPRLDWQMWFAALGSYRNNPWVGALLRRLLEGSPDVLALFAHNPFPDAPPRFVRALLYRYRFTDPQTRRETGAWWTRELLGPYSPVLAR